MITLGDVMGKRSEGLWGPKDIRRAFVEGAAWWEFHSTGATMWQSDRSKAEDEADRRYVSQQANSQDREHPAISESKSAKEIQKGYSDYLRSHRGR